MQVFVFVFFFFLPALLVPRGQGGGCHWSWESLPGWQRWWVSPLCPGRLVSGHHHHHCGGCGRLGWARFMSPPCCCLVLTAVTPLGCSWDPEATELLTNYKSDKTSLMSKSGLLVSHFRSCGRGPLRTPLLLNSIVSLHSAFCFVSVHGEDQAGHSERLLPGWRGHDVVAGKWSLAQLKSVLEEFPPAEVPPGVCRLRTL